MAKTVNELIGELMKIKDKNKPLYSAELEEEDDFPIDVDVIEVNKYVNLIFMKQKQITKKDKLENEWFKEAKEQTIDTLPTFINHIMNDYVHDYGTICHAVSACALAAAYAANSHEQGCITGFQAGFVMWDFVKQWMYEGNKCGMKIIDYDNMLYPQYGDKFDKFITKNTFKKIQKEAQIRLDESTKEDDRYELAHPRVVNHWRSIIDGNIPFGYKLKDD